MDGQKMVLKPSTNLPEKSTLIARSMVRKLTRPFKDHIQQEIASTYKTGKRKRSCIDTYNDLNEGELIRNYEKGSDKEEQQWVVICVFTLLV
jgi:hypothetical protein